MHFTFGAIYLMPFIASGNCGGSLSTFISISPLNRALGRIGMCQTLCGYDGFACFIDKSSDDALHDSKEELDILLSDSAIA